MKSTLIGRVLRAAAVWAGAQAGVAAAHEGHGMAGNSHWHAGDAWGFATLAALVAMAAAMWWRNRK